MTIYAKSLLAIASTVLLVGTPSSNEVPVEQKKVSHNVERLIDLTKKDIISLEYKIDSVLIKRGDSTIVNLINNGTVTAQ